MMRSLVRTAAAALLGLTAACGGERAIGPTTPLDYTDNNLEGHWTGTYDGGTITLDLQQPAGVLSAEGNGSYTPTGDQAHRLEVRTGGLVVNSPPAASAYSISIDLRRADVVNGPSLVHVDCDLVDAHRCVGKLSDSTDPAAAGQMALVITR